jgi:hypothetical protein
MPYMVYDLYTFGAYPPTDLFYSGLSFVLMNFGCVFSILAIQNGKAGTV